MDIYIYAIYYSYIVLGCIYLNNEYFDFVINIYNSKMFMF